jgi:hypothetical protein
VVRSFSTCAIGLAALLLFTTCKKEEDEGPAPPSGPAAAPNSIVTYGGGATSMANIACLESGALTIVCRPTFLRSLTITIPAFAGPGLYIMGATGGASGEYWADLSSTDPGYFSTPDSTGWLNITSYSTANGLIGTFSFTLYRFGSPLSFTDGVLDQVRSACTWPDALLSYTVAPLSPADHVIPSITTSEYSRFSFWRTDDQISIMHAQTAELVPPIGQQNVFTLSLPRDIAPGTHANPSTLSGFALTYDRPSQYHGAISSPSSELVITDHDAAARHITGTFNVALSGGTTASGAFDIYY